MELPLGVFAIAIGTASLPSFSEHVSKGNFDELKSSLSFSLRLMLFVIIPSMVILMALHFPVISVLFQRGAFDVQAAISTSQALFCYALGLWAFSLVRIIVPIFYSLQDAKWPLKAAIIAVSFNVIASLILMNPLKHSGLALANSLASMVNVIILSIVLKKKIGTFLDRNFYLSTGKIIISSLVMLGAITLVDFFLPWNTDAHFKARLIYLLVSIAIGAAAFFVCAYLLKSPEIQSIVQLLKKRFSRQ
jgi:putative peptidoglycan lipid II flippase